MSWFDSSFSFARTAISQAQKSIDRVLDISETPGEQNPSDSKTAKPYDTGSTSLPTSHHSSSNTVTDSNVDVVTEDSFGSTWGGTDSFWGRSPDTQSSKPVTKKKTKSKTKTIVNEDKKTGIDDVTPQENPEISTPLKPTDTPPISSLTLTSTPISVHASMNCKTTPISTSEGESIVTSPNIKTSDNGEVSLVTSGNEIEFVTPDNKIETDLLQPHEKGKREDKKMEEEEKEEEKEEKEIKETVEKEREDNVNNYEEEDGNKETEEKLEEEKPQNVMKQQFEDVPDSPPAVLEVEQITVSEEREEEEEEEDQTREKDVLNPIVSTNPEPFVKEEKKIFGDQEGKESNDENEIERTGNVELTQLKELLQVREMKLLQQSEEMIKLQDSNQEMQRYLDGFKRQMENMDEVKEELTHQVSSGEKKLQAITKERDSLKQQIQLLNNEKNQQKDSKELSELLKEKDEMIAGLMEEGEKLSKQELHSNNMIKKLRSREKQNEQLMTAQKQQIEDLENEIKRLKEMVKKKEENELKYQESMSQLNLIAEQQAKEITQIKPERDELQDKVRSLQSNLDSVYKELTEMRKTNALSQTAIEEATTYAQQNAKEVLKKQLEEQRLMGEKEKDTLLMQVNELRLNVSRTEQQATWREEQLRQEISDLHKRLQESDTRNQDLSDTISDATRPLLRQIEHLQSAHSAQASNWEKLENNLTQRLVEAHSQLNTAVEKERSAVERDMTLQSRVGGLEGQLSALRQERSQLVASLEMEKTKLQTLEETYQRDSMRHETFRLNLQQNIDELKKEKEMLERQLEYERVRLEAESRKAYLEIQEKEKLRNQLALSLSSIPPQSVSCQSSISNPLEQSEILGRSLSITYDSTGTNSFIRGTGTPLGSASILEHLQSLLKQKEGELLNSQDMVLSLERSRSSITEELAHATTTNDKLKREVDTIPILKQKLQEVSQKYEALLQMFGEKVEEAEELRLDIQDLKSMYRQQIEDLLAGKT